MYKIHLMPRKHFSEKYIIKHLLVVKAAASYVRAGMA